MQVFLSVLLCLILAFYLLTRYLPQIVLWLMKRHMRKQMRSAFEAQQQRARQEANRGGFPFWGASGQEPGQARRPAGKKIGRDVGEYVEFEEIAVYTREGEAPADPPRRKIKPDEQISDADWEEIP